MELKLKAKSEKYEKLKNEFEALKSQNEEIPASNHDNMDRAQSRILALESGIMTLKTRIKGLSRYASGPIVADPGSASGGTFQCMQFLPLFIYFSYLSYLGHTSLLGLQTKTRR